MDKPYSGLAANENHGVSRRSERAAPSQQPCNLHITLTLRLKYWERAPRYRPHAIFTRKDKVAHEEQKKGDDKK